MTSKLKLTPDPLFTAVVMIPVADGTATPTRFTFKHRPRDLFTDFCKKVPEMKQDEIILAVADGWELDDAFSPENVRTLIDNYQGCAAAVLETYVMCMTGQARVKETDGAKAARVLKEML